MFHVKQFVEKHLARFSIAGTLSIAARNLKQVEKKRTLHQKAVANDRPLFLLNNTKPIKNAEAKEEKSETAQPAPSFNGHADLLWAASLQKRNRCFNFRLRNKGAGPTFLQLLSWIDVLSQRDEISCGLLCSFVNE